MIIRIPLDETNSRLSYSYTQSGPLLKTSASANEFEAPDFSLTKVPIPAYASSRYEYPVKQIDIVVPDADKPIVAGWFGNGSSVTPSDTLIKRMTAAVISSIKTFDKDAARIGLFTCPFRLGCALRSRSGRLLQVQPPVAVFPNSQAPVMKINESTHSGDNLLTVTEIRNHAYELRVSLSPFDLPTDIDEEVTEVVFYVTRQNSMLSGDEQVTCVRSFNIDGGRYPGWYYQRMTADAVRQRVMTDTEFRIIGRIPIGRAMQGVSDYRLPDSQQDMTDFSSFPEAGDEAAGEDPENPWNPDDPDQPRPTTVTVTSDALDLGFPEQDKRVIAVTARGIFSRHPDSVQFTLYGAHHRPADLLTGAGSISAGDNEDMGRWYRIATARGPHIRLLRGIRYRWLKAEITAPYPARIDALTFGVKLRPSF